MQSLIKTLLPGKRSQRVFILVLIILAFLFGWAIKNGDNNKTPVSQVQDEMMWTCSMHPQIQQPNPGKCPICGMDLIPVKMHAAPVPGKSEIFLSENARRLAQIQVAPVERKYVESEILLVGKIAYDETRLSYITAWVPGRIERLYVDYTGITVRKGDHMVELYSPELVTTQEELLHTLESVRKSPSAMLEENLNSIRERLRLWGLSAEQIQKIENSGTASEHITIYAPISGIVLDRSGLEGMYVNTGTRLYTIADLTRVWLVLEAYESDIQWLRYGQNVEFRTEAFPGETFKGKIAFIDPVLDQVSRTVKVRVNVDNTDLKLKPGMLVSAEVHSQIAAGGKVMDPDLIGKWICPMHPEVVHAKQGTCEVCGMQLVKAESLGYVVSTKEASLVIPASAPLITGKRAVVYVQNEGKDGVFEGREVTLGPRAGDYYIVVDGLREGELVVVKGNFKIDSAVQIQARPSMMSPPGGTVETSDEHTGESGQATHAQKKPVSIPPEFRSEMDVIYDAYFSLQAALSHDDREKMSNSGAEIYDALRKVNVKSLDNKAHEMWMEYAQIIQKNASSIKSSADLEQARAEFKTLSSAMIQMAEYFGSSGKQPVLVFHCPMAFNNEGADWLQNKEGAENPYFGSRMFKCGTLEQNLTNGLSDQSREQKDE